MPVTTQNNERIEIIERMPTGVRAFLFLIGLLPWMAPYELLIKPGWQGFNLFFLFFLIVSLGAITVSLLFMGAALFGLNQTLIFDRNSRNITHTYGSTLVPLRVKKYSFDQLKNVESITHNWSDGPATHGLKFTFSDGHHAEPLSFNTRGEADELKGKIEEFRG